MVRDDEEHLSHPSQEMSLGTLRAKLKLFRMVLIIILLTAFKRLSHFHHKASF